MLQRQIAGLHVHESGSGQAVVLLHAFPLDARLFDAQLASSFDSWRLIAPDLPGFGQSPDREIQSLDDYADAVTAVLDAEDISRCVLAGVSMGGYLAFCLLERIRGRVSGLMLADTRPQADSDEVRRTREQTAARAETQGSAGVVEDLLPRLLAPSTLNGKPEVVERVRRMGSDASPSGVAQALRAMAARPDSTPLLSQIDVPTMVVVGADDAITPVAEAEAMHAAISDSTLEVIPGAGHLTPLEAPGELNAALRRLLDSV